MKNPYQEGYISGLEEDSTFDDCPYVSESDRALWFKGFIKSSEISSNEELEIEGFIYDADF